MTCSGLVTWQVNATAPKRTHRTIAAIVQPLQILEDSGPVHTEKVGRVRICRLDRLGELLAEVSG